MSGDIQGEQSQGDPWQNLYLNANCLPDLFLNSKIFLEGTRETTRDDKTACTESLRTLASLARCARLEKRLPHHIESPSIPNDSPGFRGIQMDYEGLLSDFVPIVAAFFF